MISIKEIVALLSADPVISTLRSAVSDTAFEGKVFLIGGAIRDLFFKKEFKDYDISVNLEGGDALLAEHLFSLSLCSRPKKFKKHALISCSLFGSTLQIAQTFHSHSRLEEQLFGSLKEDVLSRDFTINSLCYDISNEKLMDISGTAFIDLSAKVLNSLQTPAKCFGADPLRMLRALRLALNLDLKLKPRISAYISSHPDLLSQTPLERISDELTLILTSDFVKGLDSLWRKNIFAYLCPPLHQLLTEDRTFLALFKKAKPPIDASESLSFLLSLSWLFSHSEVFIEFSQDDTLSLQDRADFLIELLSRMFIITNSTRHRLQLILCYYLNILPLSEYGDSLPKYFSFSCDFLAEDYEHFQNLINLQVSYLFPKNPPLSFWFKRMLEDAKAIRKHHFPIGGEDILNLLGLQNRQLVSALLLISRLRWQEDPCLKAEHILNRLKAEQNYTPKAPDWSFIASVMNKNQWLNYWHQWERKAWF